MFDKKSFLKAKLKGLKDESCVNKLNEAILKVPTTISTKINKRTGKTIVFVENSKTIDLSLVHDAINNAGYRCVKIRNY